MKKQKTFIFFLILGIFFVFNGCAISTEGNTLHGFTMRMNEINPSYSMTDSGYIYNEADHTLTKYFDINDFNIMVQFMGNEKNELCSMNIVFDNLSEANTQELEFIKNCILCYCNNQEKADSLLNGIDFPQILFTKNINTTKNKVGNTEILIDVTDIGCVISVVQNTQ